MSEPPRYQCPVSMKHTEGVVKRLAGTPLGDELAGALRTDQHELFHESEFADGCDICDRERAEYA